MPASPRAEYHSMSDETRARLLASAASLFAERGFASTSLDDVASGAGLTKGAVFSSFAGKQDLLLRLVDAWQEETEAALEAGRSTPFDSLTEFVLGGSVHGRWRGMVPEFWRQAVDEESVRAHLDTAYERVRRRIASLATGWRTDVDASAVARTAVELHDGLIVLESIGDPRVADVTPAEVSRLLRRGETPRRPERAAS